MRVPRLSPLAYRRITIVAAVLLAIIIVTGAAVRLSSSGLACPVGVSCPESQLQAHGPSNGHATIEHLNRLFTGLVSVAVILAVLGSLRRIPKRRDLIWLSWGLGIVALSLLVSLLRHHAASTVAALLLVVPAVTAVMSALALGEALHPASLVGMLVAVVGVGTVLRRERGEPARRKPTRYAARVRPDVAS